MRLLPNIGFKIALVKQGVRKGEAHPEGDVLVLCGSLGVETENTLKR